MGQERISAVISINAEVAQKLSYDDLMSDLLVEMLNPYRIALWLWHDVFGLFW